MNSQIEYNKSQAIEMHKSGRIEEALKYYEKVISIDPKDIISLNNMGAIFVQKHLWSKAKSIFEKIITIDSNNSSAYCNLGLYHKKYAKHKFTLSYKLAKFFFEKSISINKNYRAALNLTILLFWAKDYQATLEMGLFTLRLIPPIDKLSRVEVLYHILSSKFRMSDFKHMKKYEKELSELLKNGVNVDLDSTICSFNLQMSLYTDKFYHDYVGAMYRFSVAPSNLENNSECLGDIKNFENQYSSKIRLGYISSDLNKHSVSLLIKDIICNHDRRKFKVFVYYIGPYMDQVTEYIKTKVDCFHHVPIKTHIRSIKHKIIKDKLNVLIDLNGHTGQSALPVLNEQLAPIQCHMLGFYGPICMKSINYFIGGKHLIPSQYRSFFPEKIIYLPDVVQSSPKFLGSDLPYTTKKDFKLPEDKFIFASFSSTYRIDIDTINLWSSILLKCPNSVLWLNTCDERVIDNIHKFFRAKKIKPDRIIFLHDTMVSEINAFKFVDLYLDTTRISAGTTTFISLSSGVPVVTLPNNRPESRTSTAILNGCDLDALVANSSHDYISICVDLYNNPKKLISLKYKILNTRDTSHSFNNSRFLYNLEQGIIQAHEHYIVTGGYKDIIVETPEKILFS